MTDWQAGFYRLNQADRQKQIASFFKLSDQQQDFITQHNEPTQTNMIENYLTSYPLAQGLSVNLTVNHQQYVVPMAIEEPSVIAAASNGAKIVAQSGGFTASKQPRLATGQVILDDQSHLDQIKTWLQRQTATITAVANQARPSLVKRGGGVKQVNIRLIDDQFISLDLLIDVGESMGANSVNTMCEAVKQWLEEQGQSVLTAILSNLDDQRLQTSSCQITVKQLATKQMTGEQVAAKIAELSQLAQLDAYRAATHNKGIMNGIDAAVIALGNDWRAVEAAVHSYAATDGHYRGVSRWWVEADQLKGQITVPMPIGVVGGSMDVLPMVKINRQISNVADAAELAQVITSLGLAQNLAALKALATKGIQAGHMKLQYKSWALALGATTAELPQIMCKLVSANKVDRQLVAKVITQIRGEQHDRS